MSGMIDLPIGSNEPWVKRRVAGPDIDGNMQVTDIIDLTHPKCPITGFPFSSQIKEMLDENRAASVRAAGVSAE